MVDEIVSSEIFEGIVPDKSPAAELGNESYIGSINSPLIAKSIDSVGDITKSNSNPSLDYGSKIFAPSSNTSDSSGSAYLLPKPVFGPTGVPAAARAAVSAASGKESLEIFHAVAL